MLKDRCGEDGFLGWLHSLMLMDDTVIMATSRERLLVKLDVLHEYCISHGMVINEDKTKLMVINGSEMDRGDVDFHDTVIKHCSRYVYLGSIFTADGSLISSLKEHCADQQKHFHKLVMFLKTNCDIPFSVKRKIVDAAYNAAILYSCESWLGASCIVMNIMYMGGIKALLGVRTTTANDLCLAELGQASLKTFVKQRQYNFLRKLLAERQNMNDDPFMFVLSLTRRDNRKMSRWIFDLMSRDAFVKRDFERLHDIIRTSQKTKYVTYMGINPNLMVHNVYSHTVLGDEFIPEVYRISFSQMRLSSHRLRIEVGRWSRLPREARLCPCGQIQDECHVLRDCPLTQPVRHAYSSGANIVFLDILNDAKVVKDFQYIYDVQRSYE